MMLETSLCSAISFAGARVPDWVHLLPAGTVQTKDGRGPYRLGEAGALISLSMAGGKLPIDENHSTDLAAPNGGPSPARGWIVELQHRADGIWGRVEWTGTGRRLIEQREYAGLSPVIVHNKAGVVSAILRASLTNTPNLAGLTSLHNQGSGSAKLAQLRVDIRRLGEQVAQQAEKIAGGASGAPSSAEAVLNKARDLLVEKAKEGSPPTFASIVGGLMDGPTDAVLTAADLNMIERLGVDRDAYLRRKTEAMAKAVAAPTPRAIREKAMALQAQMASAGLPIDLASAIASVTDEEAQAKPSDGLTASERNVVALLGTDPAVFLKGRAASQNRGGSNG